MAGSNQSAERSKKWALDYEAKIQAMKTFRSLMADRETVAIVQNDDDAFHDILADAERRGYVHYTRLAAAMGLKDSSTVSRWFKRKAAPDRFRRAFALSALDKIVANDIRRMESDEGLNAIGHLSMKEYENLEIDVVDLVA